MLTRHGPDVGGPFAQWLKQRTRAKLSATDLASAREALGEIVPGGVLVGVTKGKFSLLDLLDAVLAQTGPATVDVSTWTMGVYDADALWRTAENGLIKRMRFLLDPSMFGRREDLASAFIFAFGSQAIRAVDNHAKFCTIRGADLDVTITGSMNLNRNARLENFVVIEGADVADFYSAIVDRVWAVTAERFEGKKRSRIEFDALSIEAVSGAEPVVDVW